VAAARALASLAGVEPPPNGRIATDLLLATENLADHLTHFYLFFMPDFARPAYAGRAWQGEAAARFGAGRGHASAAAIAARQRWMELMGTLGGRWPHTGSLQPGGSARAIEAAERLRLRARVAEMRRFLEEQLFGDALEAVTALPDVQTLDAWVARAPGRGDLRLFLAAADDLGLGALGPGPGRWLAYGGTDQPGGLFDGRAVTPLDLDAVTEDAHHAWLADGPALHPRAGRTEPQADKSRAYSWNKAPRLAGRVVETGAVARALVAGRPLLRSVVARHGGGVLARVLARVLETALIVPRMEGWLAALTPREPFCVAAPLPADGAAVGLAEAARGALGHWISVRGGRLERYQIVAPTSWNFSPRDAAGTPGALEAALVGTPVADGEVAPVAVQHVVRSFDPCMVCTVH
jgi:hydrogenase large subunit